MKFGETEVDDLLLELVGYAPGAKLDWPKVLSGIEAYINRRVYAIIDQRIESLWDLEALHFHH